LLVAAFAILGVQAMAMAPVIGDIPSPIIGDEGIATPANIFVYPDAIDLDRWVTDDTTPSDQIIWSYDGTGNYLLNGVDPIDTGNPDNPGANRIDNQDLDPGAVDSDPRTVTFRNANLTPIGQSPGNPPGFTGVNAEELITLFASDGTTFTMKELFVYTDAGGNDRLSGVADAIRVQDINWLVEAPNALTMGWISTGLGPITFSNNVNEGLCWQVPLTGVSLGQWISPYPFIELAANSVFECRLDIDAAGVTLPADTAPLFSFIVDNFANDGSVVDNKAAAEWLWLDNLGGANSPGLGGSVGRNEFRAYFTPAPVIDAGWNSTTTGMFQPSMDANNDFRVQWRGLDVDGIGYGGEFDQGNMCLRAITIDQISIDAFTVLSTPYNATNLTNARGQGPNGPGTSLMNSIVGQTSVNFAGGDVTVQQSAANGWDIDIVSFTPGNEVSSPLLNPAETADNFPVIQESNKLYKVTIGAIAPNATAVSNPPDGIRLGADNAVTEVLHTNNVLATVNTIGLPIQGSETVYTAFYYTHNATLSQVSDANRIRPRADVLLSPQVGIPTVDENAGGITFTFMRMDEVAVPIP
jgi:hypothetical protein